MKSVEKSAKTVEEAIKQGLKELECESTDVDIDVIDLGSPGLFGMFGRLAKVKLTLKEQEPDIASILKEAEVTAQPERPAPVPKRQEPKQQPVQKRERAEAPPAAEREYVERKQAEPSDPPARVQEELPPTDVSALSETGRLAYDFLYKLVSLMGVDVDIRLAESEGQITAQMTGDTLGILIGRRGETLDALQYLTSLVVNKHREGYIRVSLDTEHYRAKREEALIKLANRMAGRARKTGGRVALEPMNPYERRILHSALQGHPYVTTHSEGEEPYRRVVITLK